MVGINQKITFKQIFLKKVLDLVINFLILEKRIFGRKKMLSTGLIVGICPLG